MKMHFFVNTKISKIERLGTTAVTPIKVTGESRLYLKPGHTLLSDYAWEIRFLGNLQYVNVVDAARSAMVAFFDGEQWVKEPISGALFVVRAITSQKMLRRWKEAVRAETVFAPTTGKIVSED